MIKIKRALISVSDKTGITDLGQCLHDFGVQLLSTGGTAKALKEAGLNVTDVSQVTGFPEMMNGRVKTLHPNIHGGLLALRENPDHMTQLKEQGIETIDMVVVNLYPFAQTVAKPDVTLAEAIENIDIGGPSMIRSAAKNYKSVAIVVNPSRYQEIIREMRTHDGALGDETLAALAVEAFDQTAEYDAGIHRYLSAQQSGGAPSDFPDTIRMTFHKQQALRYGENPHQQACFYRQNQYSHEPSVTTAKQLHGKELSFNNIIDINAALEIVKDFSEPAACVIKHTNPCGAAVADNISDAYQRAFDADSLSAFGGIVGLNRPCTLAIAEKMKDVFLECVIAPSFEQEALSLLTNKKNIRLMACGELTTIAHHQQTWMEMDAKRVVDGLLLQDRDLKQINEAELKTVSNRQPTEEELKDLLFAWRVCKHVKSNAILIAKQGRTLGVGPGQTNRVGAAHIAVQGAGDSAKGAVVASDAFFPFRDGIDALAKVGIKAVIQPGGSVNDEEVITAANEHDMAMLFTGIRHFKH